MLNEYLDKAVKHSQFDVPSNPCERFAETRIQLYVLHYISLHPMGHQVCAHF